MSETTLSQTLFITVRGGDIAYADSGPAAGSTFVLSHSLFFDRTMFDDLAALLVEAGHRVVSYDHRGQGESSPAPRGRLTMDHLTEDAAALVQGLGLGRVHFVGNSMGGFVALRLAAAHPELLLSAVAISSSAEEEHQREAFGPLVDAMAENGTAPFSDTILHIMFGDASLAEAGPTIDHWRTRIESRGTAVADPAWNVVHRERIVEKLADVTVPVLAISGAEDHTYPPPVSDENIAAATGGSWRRVEQAGHSAALEQPEAVLALLLEHVAASA